MKFLSCIVILVALLIPSICSAESKSILVLFNYVSSYSEIPLNNGLYYPEFLGAARTLSPGVCVIYVKKPSNTFDTLHLEILGHEILHCTDGSFHPESQK